MRNTPLSKYCIMWTVDGEVKHNMDFATETLHAHIDSNPIDVTI